ncbi:MAG: polysaccharide deacetylase family protein [Candidatus Scalindua sp.]|nr:polysaccharide deacetylase family protein [Candidatus Scalindua sp.]MBT5305046.1 polysaccharide deacetylase family protein [Candidatus Scalindua sp.]MBT6046890.1 polysaccharide deacetylase family protein [Candidatus Scalindua sp.]MBT6228710.1 polysaccharide deacetylase family protein [Candidatus Scalindua sp.]MBT6563265.1 polysaccharide deacetylase family protein [Candidatus Scalindua sp.]
MFKLRRFIKFIVAFIFYYSGIFIFYKRFVIKGKVTILMFHRVTDTFFDVSLLVKRKTFEECMQYIARRCPVISLDFLVQNFDRWESVPHNSYVVTFDDGWIDFYDTAYPVLSRLKIPATVYLTTGFASLKCSYWQERLDNLLAQIFAEKRTLLTKDNIISIPEINLKLKYLILNSGGAEVTFKFIDYLKEFTHDKILKTITDLEVFQERHSIKVDNNKERSFVSWDELNHIKDPNISFGSHTVNHMILTNEQTDVVKEEISKSKEIIEKETERSVIHFCYPNGNNNDGIKEIVAKSYKSACTTKGGFVSKDSDIYSLNRIGINEEMVTDWRGNFSKYVFIYSIFIESLKA